MPKARSKVSRKRKFYGNRERGLPRNRIINFQALLGIISILCCTECYATGLKLAEDSKERLCSNLCIPCSCGFMTGFTSTPNENKKFSLNTLLVFGLRLIGRGFIAGLIQKRVGSRLRKLKKNTKGLGGKEKLTDKFIDKLQNYYRIAIRSNVGCLEKMQSAVIAAFFHCCSSNQNPMHGQCPTGKDSWCKYKQALFDGKVYVDKTAGLSNSVIKVCLLI
ncbi:uncharacterized protein TNCV_2763971 [Trichonephila clavipes]|nr:uncharacterized protein TNCV_2763971 [Trichonephila clavipes]